MTIFETFDKIEKTSSRLEIESILQYHKDNSNDDYMEKCLDIAMNPYRKFHINKIPKVIVTNITKNLFYPHIVFYDTKMSEFFKLIEKLEKREITGNKAKDAVESFLKHYCYNENEVKYLTMIIRKGFDIGLGFSTIEKIYPGLLKEYKLQLCTTYDTKKHSLKNRIEQDKFNGFRCNAMFNEITNEWEFFSRNGKQFHKANFGNIEKDLNFDEIFKNYVFDGELDCGDFELTSSVANTEKFHPENEKMIFRIFDIISKKDWIKQSCSVILKDRLNLLYGLIDNANFKYIYAVEIINFISEYDKNKIDEITMKAILKGNDIEGVVLKDINSTYNFNRDESWIRIKPFQDNEFEIVSINEGKKKGTTGSITVKGLDNQTGIYVNANVAGIIDKIKTDMWNNKEKYIGKFAQIGYQYVTKKGSLRHSNFIKMRDKFDE